MVQDVIISNLKSGLALDIDETLAWTVGEWISLLEKKFGKKENLSTKELVEKYQYAQNVPDWQTKEGREYIEELRVSNEVYENLPLIEGAVEFVNKINIVVPISVYLTTRPESVISGTRNWILKNGFPSLPVICRPNSIAPKEGNKWKAEVLKQTYPKVSGIIDDNQDLLSYLDDDYQGKVFLYNSTVVPEKVNVLVCPTWPKVYAAVLKFKK